MSEALEVVQPQTQRGILSREVLEVQTEQRALLAEYVQKHMVEGTDYGVIPGTKDRSLLKPGAEKLVELFRCTPKFVLTERIEDFDRPLFAYTFRVRLFQRDAGVVLAEGFGSANSRESKYRWRTANLKCPACQKDTAVIKGKEEYGGGWVCFSKKGGCGAKFKDNDPSIVDQPRGQVENTDVATLANTILKMAKKRALVDGAIALARVSDIFTQDVEDLDPDLVASRARPEKSESKKAAEAPAQQQSSSTTSRPPAETGNPPSSSKPAPADSGSNGNFRPVELMISKLDSAKTKAELDAAIEGVKAFDEEDRTEVRKYYIARSKDLK